jgi:hypothetical protein
MKTVTAWIAIIGLIAWIAIMGAQKGLLAATVLMHWPVALILVVGFLFDLKGSLAAMLVGAAYLVLLRMAGVLDSWTLVGWQVLVYGMFGMYPFRFMQVREERKHHYRTLIEYKRGELEGLRKKASEIDRQCRECEDAMRVRPGI